MTEATPKIRMRGVCKAFGEKVVLDGLDLEVGRSESVVVIGGSGTGKSVMLKCILGLLQPVEHDLVAEGLAHATHADFRGGLGHRAKKISVMK